LHKRCLLLELGLVEYGEAFRFQRAIAEAREADLIPDFLIALEHPPVLTLGRRANQGNILAPADLLKREGVALYQSTRGGDVTYHGPGQLVGYPIVNLRQLKLGAARVYGMHAEKWPDDPNHSTALRNGAVELDLAKRGPDAAERYLAFGKEDRCVQASPDVAALALHRAGELFMNAKRRPDAREAFETAAAIQGVKSPEAKQRVADAARQAKKLGGTAAGRRSPRR
jgi:hypothetical protein